jgi:hypothetical protein
MRLPNSDSKVTVQIQGHREHSASAASDFSTIVPVRL